MLIEPFAIEQLAKVIAGYAFEEGHHLEFFPNKDTLCVRGISPNRDFYWDIKHQMWRPEICQK